MLERYFYSIAFIVIDCFFKHGDVDFALADYHQALEMDPSNQVAHSRVAVVYSQQASELFEDKLYVVSLFSF